MITYFYYLPGKNSLKKKRERETDRRSDASPEFKDLSSAFVAVSVPLKFLASELGSEHGNQWGGLRPADIDLEEGSLGEESLEPEAGCGPGR